MIKLICSQMPGDSTRHFLRWYTRSTVSMSFVCGSTDIAFVHPPPDITLFECASAGTSFTAPHYALHSITHRNFFERWKDTPRPSLQRELPELEADATSGPLALFIDLFRCRAGQGRGSNAAFSTLLRAAPGLTSERSFPATNMAKIDPYLPSFSRRWNRVLYHPYSSRRGCASEAATRATVISHRYSILEIAGMIRQHFPPARIPTASPILS